MKTKILFLQGGGEGAYEADKKLVSSLKDNLGENYELIYPQIPSEEDPEYENYSPVIDQVLENSKRIILVGHSLGACFLLKYLSDNKVSAEIPGLFLLSTPFWGKGGWQYEGFTLNLNFKKILQKKISIYFYQGLEDETVAFHHLDLYRKKFPNAKFKEIAGVDHQLNNDLKDVAVDIKNL